MKKPWSITTTTRNPYRLRDQLFLIKEKLTNLEWNSETQIYFQTLLIQKRLYGYQSERGFSQQFLNGLSKNHQKIFTDLSSKINLETAKDIFENKRYNDPPMRGRQSFNPFKKLGFVTLQNKKIAITELGEYFLSDSYDIGRVFFKNFIKWQYPNPLSREFSTNAGFSIKPFVGTLHLINEVNKLWAKRGNESVGMSKDEFSLFVPTLIDYRDIKNQAKQVIEYRVEMRSQKDDKTRKQYKEEFRKNFAKTFLETSNDSEIAKLLSNLKDYGDNTIRYFRLTRYLHIRGGGFYIDLEPRRSIEINKLLSTDDATPLVFRNADEYIKYLANLEQPKLPWETKVELKKIALNLNQDVQSYVISLSQKAEKIPVFDFKKVEMLNESELKQYIEDLRLYRRKLQELEIHFESQSVANIQKYIDALKNIHQSENKASIELERLSTLALNALNDALEIKPNYPVGDDNEPTFTAPANKPDIECFYEKFNSVCEVTMLTDRSQWYNEGQPVMRHIRNFENNYNDKAVYGLFVAPRLHQDTIETFWMAVKYGYKGTTQKIIPLSISQFIRLLEILLEIKKQRRRFTHDELLKLYKKILGLTSQVSHSGEWIEQIPEIITEWQKDVLTK